MLLSAEHQLEFRPETAPGRRDPLPQRGGQDRHHRHQRHRQEQLSPRPGGPASAGQRHRQPGPQRAGLLPVPEPQDGPGGHGPGAGLFRLLPGHPRPHGIRGQGHAHPPGHHGLCPARGHPLRRPAQARGPRRRPAPPGGCPHPGRATWTATWSSGWRTACGNSTAVSSWSPTTATS